MKNDIFSGTEKERKKQSLVYIRRAGNEQIKIKKKAWTQFSSVLIFVFFLIFKIEKREGGTWLKWVMTPH